MRVKTAVSLPDDVFADAERLAARLGWSRSQLYAKAVEEFVAAHADEDAVTAALDRLADQLDTSASYASGKALIDAGLWEW